MIKICMNGDRSKSDTPYVPISIDEYSKEIKWFISRSINIFHIHFRDLSGNESLEQEIIEPQFIYLKKQFPSCKIGIGTPLHNGMTSKKRKELISQWTWAPDFLSLNLSEEGSLELSRILSNKQIPIEYGIFSMEDATAFEKYHLQETAYRVLIEVFNMKTPKEAVETTQELVSFFQTKFPNIELVLHGEDSNTWTIIYYAINNGLSFRIGVEDTLVDWNNNQLLSNKALYEEVLRYQSN